MIVFGYKRPIDVVFMPKPIFCSAFNLWGFVFLEHDGCFCVLRSLFLVRFFFFLPLLKADVWDGVATFSHLCLFNVPLKFRKLGVLICDVDVTFTLDV